MGDEETMNLCGNATYKRRALDLYQKALTYQAKSPTQNVLLITAFATAIAEESASQAEVPSAPSLCSSGVLGAVLYFLWWRMPHCYKEGEHKKEGEGIMVEALAVASFVINLVRARGTISAIEGGC